MQQRTTVSSRAGGDAARFPFPSLPKGWFVVATSDEIPPDQVVPLRYFGLDLVAFRGASGAVNVVGAHCPHLGANLAHGGTIEGDCIRCPFHGWRFEGDGRCVEVPYSERIPPKARLDALPVLEQDGCVHVFYSPAPLEPGEPWPLPALDLSAYSPGKLIHWRELRTHPQEVCENTVDTAHIGPVHDGLGARVIGEPVRERERMTIELEFEAPGDVVDMPGTFNDVFLHVTMHGLGHMAVRTQVRNVDIHALQRIYCTPVDEHCMDLRGIVHVKPTDDPEFSAELAEIFYRAYVEDFARDFPIWENKRYLLRPSLAKGDGPIGLYRRWCAQFYVETGTSKGTAAEPSHASASASPPRRSSLLAPVRERVVGGAAQLLTQTKARAPWLAGVADLLAPLVPRTDDDDGFYAGDSPGPSQSKSKSKPAPASAPTLRIASVQDYIDTLPQRFVASAAEGVDAVFQWDLSGDEGRIFHAIVRDRTLEVVDGPHPRPTTTLAISAADYVAVINGELDGMRAFASGKGKVSGSIKAAMKMRGIFPG